MVIQTSERHAEFISASLNWRMLPSIRYTAQGAATLGKRHFGKRITIRTKYSQHKSFVSRCPTLIVEY